ncbi:Rap1a/Tai family immunity protein [Magnetospira sp. QH-2]|uniref:Rap1a/Tai family immunity protein n=1 Tax=Magnetospira sp. (strain QH-2) TaxID=1288970 RepID=UPI0003E80FDC|nr:Rap1a/Tai family immunity protein [Magnetospira sp. QH-2]CCQ74190.1 Exported protein of unknown function [Magnetospira sp. QH-2]
MKLKLLTFSLAMMLAANFSQAEELEKEQIKTIAHALTITQKELKEKCESSDSASQAICSFQMGSVIYLIKYSNDKRGRDSSCEDVELTKDQMKNLSLKYFEDNPIQKGWPAKLFLVTYYKNVYPCL